MLEQMDQLDHLPDKEKFRHMFTFDAIMVLIAATAQKHNHQDTYNLIRKYCLGTDS
mgnify:CR=1 FL=1